MDGFNKQTIMITTPKYIPSTILRFEQKATLLFLFNDEKGTISTTNFSCSYLWRLVIQSSLSERYYICSLSQSLEIDALKIQKHIDPSLFGARLYF